MGQRAVPQNQRPSWLKRLGELAVGPAQYIPEVIQTAQALGQLPSPATQEKMFIKVGEGGAPEGIGDEAAMLQDQLKERDEAIAQLQRLVSAEGKAGKTKREELISQLRGLTDIKGQRVSEKERIAKELEGFVGARRKRLEGAGTLERLDLSPVIALTEAWTGERFSQGYKPPKTKQEEAVELLQLETIAKEQRAEAGQERFKALRETLGELQEEERLRLSGTRAKRGTGELTKRGEAITLRQLGDTRHPDYSKLAAIARESGDTIASTVSQIWGKSGKDINEYNLLLNRLYRAQIE